ncbi:MAG TPA: Flp pilus assembly protein CpaB [Candidatus Dormibacteraeota bacterium]
MPSARPAASPSKPLLLVLGAVITLASFIGAFAVGILSSEHAHTDGPVQVIAALHDIQAREVLSAGDVGIVTMPRSAVPPAVLTKPSQIDGATALVTILKGQAITSNITTHAPDQMSAPAPAYLPIPQGWLALTIPTNEQEGVAGYIAAGDYVNVVVTVSTGTFGANPPKTVTKTILTKVHVIRVGPQSATVDSRESPQRAGVSSSLTIVVQQCDAAYLTWFLANTSLRYELVSHADYSATIPATQPACPETDAGVGPAQVEARYGFTRI